LRIRLGGGDRCRKPSSPRALSVALEALLEQDLNRAGTALGGLASSGGAVPCGTAPAEVSRARDQGAFARPAPSVAIARDGSFAPTRSARTPRVASSSRRRLERPTPQTHPLKQRACPSRTRQTSLLSLGSPNDPLTRAARHLRSVEGHSLRNVPIRSPLARLHPA